MNSAFKRTFSILITGMLSYREKAQALGDAQ